MARTVDTSSTLEDFRQSYNGLAEEIGGLSDLRTSNKTSVVNAINSIQDQFFFFQDHEFDGSDGASSNTVFSGADNFGVTLKYSVNRLLVFKNGTLLRRGTEFTATNGTSVTLTSSAANSDIIRIVTYTGSYEGVSAAVTGQSGANNLISAGGALHNNNSGGFVINGDSNTVQLPTVSNSVEFNGSNGVFFNDNIFVNAESSSPNEIRFRDADNSNYVALKAANTIGSNVSFVLPSSDGSNGHVLKTDGSGNLSFGTAVPSGVDVTANNSTDETIFPVFVDGQTGEQGLETDSGFTYNPSSGTLTATIFVGALTGNSSTATALANARTIGGVSFDGTANINLPGVNASGNQDTSGNAATATALATARTIHGVSFDGSANIDLSEVIQDTVGAMVSSNTESGISVSYEDGDGTLDFSVSGITSSMITDGTIATADVADDAITRDKLADDCISADQILGVSGNGTSGQALTTDGDGTFSFTTITGNAYDLEVPSSTTAIRLAQSAGGSDNDDVTLTGGTGISVTRTSASELTITNSSVYSPWSFTTDTNGNESVASGDLVTIQSGTGISVTHSGDAITITNTSPNAATTRSDLSIGTGNNVQFGGIGVGTSTMASTEIRATGEITAFYSSDIALKENINPIENALNKVMSLGGYNYDWKDSYVEKRGGIDGYFVRKSDIGVLAHEVEKVVPEAHATREDGTGAVRYEKIVPLLIEAIKDLNKEIKELKNSKT